MYKLTETHEPFAIDEDQEMWVAEISYYGNKIVWGDWNHQDCIEVRAENEDSLKFRVLTILRALNEEL